MSQTVIICSDRDLGVTKDKSEIHIVLNEDDAHLALKDGQIRATLIKVDKKQVGVEKRLVTVKEVKDNKCLSNEKWGVDTVQNVPVYQWCYTLNYQDSETVPPGTLITSSQVCTLSVVTPVDSYQNECIKDLENNLGHTSVVTNTIVGHKIADHFDGESTTVAINESVTTLVDNLNNTATYTNELGVETTISTGGGGGGGSISVVTDTVPGHKIAQHFDGSAINVDINETITSLVDNGNGTATFTDETGATNNIDTGGAVSVVTNTVVGHLIATHDDGDGTLININETVTSLVDNGNGTATFTDETGATNNIDTGGAVSVVTNVIAGNRIATHDDGDGTLVDIDETITTLVDNGNDTFTYTNEAGANTVFPVGGNTSSVTNTVAGHLIATHDDGTGTLVNINETVTTLVDNGNGTATFTDENGSSNNIDTSGNTSVVTNTVAGHLIATHDDGDGTLVSINETVTSLVDNGNGTATFTDENGNSNNIDTGGAVSVVTNVIAGNRIATHDDGDGTIVDIDETITSLVDNGNGTATFTDETGATNNIDTSGNTSVVTNVIAGNRIATHDDGTGTLVDIDETITSLVDNGNGTATFTDETGATNNINTGGAVSVITNTVAGHRIATHDDGDGTLVDIDETITALVDNADGTYTYMDEDGSSNNLTSALNRSFHTGTQTASTISDFDTEVSNNPSVVLNTAKVTNATHTGEVTGSGALLLDKTAISNRSAVAVAEDDFILFGDTDDTDNLKKVSVGDLVLEGLPDTICATDDTISLEPTSILTGSPYSLVIDGPVTNLIVNPIFEVNHTDGWSVHGTATLSRNTTEKYIGSASMQITTSTANSGTISSAMSVSANTRYVFSCWVRGAVGGEELTLEMKGNISAATNSYGNFGAFGSLGNAVTTEWKRFRWYYTTGATDTTMDVRVRCRGASAQTIYLDGCQVEEKERIDDDFATSFACGAMGKGYEWTGTAHNSTSTRTAGFKLLAPITAPTRGYLAQRTDGAFTGKFEFFSDRQGFSQPLDNVDEPYFAFNIKGDMETNIITSGASQGVCLIENQGNGVAAYLKSAASTKVGVIMDFGSLTSGTGMAIFAPADLTTMVSAGGKFFEFADKSGASSHQWTPVFSQSGVFNLPYYERHTLIGKGSSTTTNRALAGTLSVVNGSPVITGTGTAFLSDFRRGDNIQIFNGTGYDTFNVDSIASNTSLTLNSNYNKPTNGSRVYRSKTRQQGAASLQLAGGWGDHSNAHGDFVYSMYAHGSTGQLYVKQGSARENLDIPAEGEGDPLVTKKFVDTTTRSIIASGAETTVITGYTVPAHQLEAGKILRISFFGQFTPLAATSTITWRVKLGGTTVLTSNAQQAAVTGAIDIAGEIHIVGTSLTAQKCSINILGKGTSGASAVTHAIVERGTGAVDCRLNRALTVTADFSDASSLNVETAWIELI